MTVQPRFWSLIANDSLIGSGLHPNRGSGSRLIVRHVSGSNCLLCAGRFPGTRLPPKRHFRGRAGSSQIHYSAGLRGVPAFQPSCRLLDSTAGR